MLTSPGATVAFIAGCAETTMACAPAMPDASTALAASTQVASDSAGRCRQVVRKNSDRVGAVGYALACPATLNGRSLGRAFAILSFVQ